VSGKSDRFSPGHDIEGEPSEGSADERETERTAAQEHDSDAGTARAVPGATHETLLIEFVENDDVLPHIHRGINDQRALERDDVIREVVRSLRYERTGKDIRHRIGSVINVSVRRRILMRDGAHYIADCRTIREQRPRHPHQRPLRRTRQRLVAPRRVHPQRNLLPRFSARREDDSGEIRIDHKWSDKVVVD